MKNWLYPNNENFWKNKSTLPVNYDEIISNFRTEYGISELSNSLRFTQFGISFLLSLLLIISFLLLIMNTANDIINNKIDAFGLIVNLLFIVSVLIGASLSLYSVFTLLTNRHKLIDKNWDKLINTGILLNGKVESISAVSWRERRLIYEYSNPDGKLVRGQYFVTDSPKQNIKEVAVWYVNDKLHTLL